jgi:hypothetical protein
MAVYELPTNMQPFFHRNLAYLVRHSIRPDQRQKTDPAEGARHYINFEAFGDAAALRMPPKWEEAVAKYSKDSLHKHGYLPYWIELMQKRLTAAFRNRNADSIIFYAADISHYLSDAVVPLHTTINYNGELTNQKGIHGLWETMIPELELRKFSLSSKHSATYLSHPEVVVWKHLHDAHRMVADLLKAERITSKSFTSATKYRTQLRNGKEHKTYTSAFARAYNKQLRFTVNQQIIHAVNLTADFWFTAWVEAGRPDLSGLLKPPFTRKESEQLQTEREAFSKNELLKKNLLLAKKKESIRPSKMQQLPTLPARHP